MNMIPLDTGDQLVDREKSKILLHYLAKASRKWDERDLRHRKTEIAVNQFKKLDTERLSKELGTIEDHLQKALRQEKLLAEHQAKEGHDHDDIQHKIKKLEHKLTRYVQTEHARKRRVRELDLKVKAAHGKRADFPVTHNHKSEKSAGSTAYKSVDKHDREKMIVHALGELLSLKKRFGTQASAEQMTRLELKMEKLKHELVMLKKQ